MMDYVYARIGINNGEQLANMITSHDDSRGPPDAYRRRSPGRDRSYSSVRLGAFALPISLCHDLTNLGVKPLTL